jgi:hypothetical protein
MLSITVFGRSWPLQFPALCSTTKCANKHAGIATNSTLSGMLPNGKAYEYATQKFLNSIDNPTQHSEVVDVFTQAMQTV